MLPVHSKGKWRDGPTERLYKELEEQKKVFPELSSNAVKAEKCSCSFLCGIVKSFQARNYVT